MEGNIQFSEIEISIEKLIEEDSKELSSFSCGVDELYIGKRCRYA